MARVAFLGLGVMGFPMARHLAAAGHDLTVYNRTFAKADAWVAVHGGRAALSPAAAAAGADVVFTCVGNDEDLRSVVLGPDGAFAAMSKGALFVDHTTVSASIARELAEAGDARGLYVVDAPVSGGQAGAEAGQLTIMCGGQAAAFACAEPVMAAYAKRIGHMGPAGSGQLTKMVNQICITGVLQGLSEALTFATAAGLDADAVVDVISKGAAQSWQMDLPLTALVDGFYAEVQAMGGARQDTSSLIRRYRG